MVTAHGRRGRRADAGKARRPRNLLESIDRQVLLAIADDEVLERYLKLLGFGYSIVVTCGLLLLSGVVLAGAGLWIIAHADGASSTTAAGLGLVGGVLAGRLAVARAKGLMRRVMSTDGRDAVGGEQRAQQ
jgi:hypothetical protein